MKRLVRVKTLRGKLLQNVKYFDDNCLSELKTADEAIKELVYYCELVKTIHKGFHLDTLKNLMKICH